MLTSDKGRYITESDIAAGYVEPYEQMGGDGPVGTFPTPVMPSDLWDEFAIAYGYPYRGQPSVVYSVPFELGNGVDVEYVESATSQAAGRPSWEHWRDDYGLLEPMSDERPLSDNEGSSIDRLRRDANGSRFVVTVRDSDPSRPDNRRRRSSHTQQSSRRATLAPLGEHAVQSAAIRAPALRLRSASSHCADHRQSILRSRKAVRQRQPVTTRNA